jgi:hypothetical protein
MVFGLDGWLIPPTHVVSAEVQHFSHVVTDAMRLGHPHVSLEVFGVLNYGFREEIAETMVASCRAVACPCNMDVDGCGWMWMDVDERLLL